MNGHYSYENMDLWDEAKWRPRMNPVFPLVKWIGKSLADVAGDDAGSGYDACDREGICAYNPKSLSMEDPEVIGYWRVKGVVYKSFEMGGVRWIAMVPAGIDKASGKKLPVLLILHRGDYSDPFWAMKAIQRHRDRNEAAAKDGMALIYVVKAGDEPDMMYVSILMEAFSLFPLDGRRVYLDLGPALDNGRSLEEVPGLANGGSSDGSTRGPWGGVERLGSGKIPVIDISDRWQNKDSAVFGQIMEDRNSDASYDRAKMIHCATARKFASAMRLEHEYDGPDDPGLARWLLDQGVRCDRHETRGERWLTLAPLSAYEEPDSRLPALICMQEVGYSNDHLILTALSYFHEYIEIAAQGEMMIIFFALESPDDNDMLVDILRDAEASYPIDRRRVYITGHSHNALYSMEFARRHHESIAAIATLGIAAGLATPEECGIPDQRIEEMRGYDLPAISLSGCCESGCLLPVNRLPDTARPSKTVIYPSTAQKRIESWRRRLRAARCPVKSPEEIARAAKSPDVVERKLGIPADRTETLFIDGLEHYIADIKNDEGKYHLRVVGVENAPHTPTPGMITLSWSFMRGFARDLETGKTIELY